MTASHCLKGLESDLYVTAGLDHQLLTTLKSEKNLRKAKRLLVHPTWQTIDENKVPVMSYLDDIALVELEKPFEFSEETNIMPGM